jgi:predicted GIY-YIG superfamily endonuclease
VSNPYPSGKSALYKLYDSANTLLYVGITRHPDVRFKEHAGDKPWWHLVTREEIVWLADRDAAIKAEAQAMVDERPLYNGYHHLGKGWPQKARQYDDTTDRETVRSGMRAAIERGDYRPRAFIWAAPVGRQYGVAPVTAFHALHDLVKEGLLETDSGRFWVPGPLA